MRESQLRGLHEATSREVGTQAWGCAGPGGDQAGLVGQVEAAGRAETLRGQFPFPAAPSLTQHPTTPQAVDIHPMWGWGPRTERREQAQLPERELRVSWPVGGVPSPCCCPSSPVHLMFKKTFLGKCGKANLYRKHT